MQAIIHVTLAIIPKIPALQDIHIKPLGRKTARSTGTNAPFALQRRTKQRTPTTTPVTRPAIPADILARQTIVTKQRGKKTVRSIGTNVQSAVAKKTRAITFMITT